jgi:choline kinase
MKVIILAAGMGSRFENHDAPKALIRLSNEKTILGMQLESISLYGHLDHVIIVVGYMQELFRERFPNLTFIVNPQYDSTNTARSLLIALNQVDEDDVIWINGDVVFHPYILQRLIAFGKTAMVVNTEQVLEEEVKYSTDGVGKIVEVSKLVQSPDGEALGINMCKADDLAQLKKNLARCGPNDYFERAVQYCIDEGMEVWAVPVKGTAAVEVDFAEDLEKANHLIERWNQNII